MLSGLLVSRPENANRTPRRNAGPKARGWILLWDVGDHHLAADLPLLPRDPMVAPNAGESGGDDVGSAKALKWLWSRGEFGRRVGPSASLFQPPLTVSFSKFGLCGRDAELVELRCDGRCCGEGL